MARGQEGATVTPVQTGEICRACQTAQSLIKPVKETHVDAQRWIVTENNERKTRFLFTNADDFNRFFRLQSDLKALFPDINREFIVTTEEVQYGHSHS